MGVLNQEPKSVPLQTRGKWLRAMDRATSETVGRTRKISFFNRSRRCSILGHRFDALRGRSGVGSPAALRPKAPSAGGQ